MEKNIIREQLVQRYIEPTKKERQKYVGIEIEIPILNEQKEAVDFEVVHKVTKNFMDQFHFTATGIDDEGNVYAAVEKESGDILSYDCSYNNLELSLGRQKELHTLYQHFHTYYTYLQKEFSKYHYRLTGMGVNPYRHYNHNVPIPNGRYRMLFHHLNSYKNYDLPMYFHEYPGYGLFSSASQVQLDVKYDELIETINTFSKLEPVKALLFSNSILLGEKEDLICCRDMFWENSTHGINPHNIGMFDCDLSSVEDLKAYIESTSIYCVERGDKYINFPPVPIMEYFTKEQVKGEYYSNGEYHEIFVTPELKDIEYLRTFKFEDLTFRGTIEFRSVCCQPIKDCMTVAAFHVGLKENLKKVTKLLEQDTVLYHHGFTQTELRKMMNRRKLPAFVDEDALYELAEKVLDLAKEGLLERGYKEENMLLPLYERIKERTNPARKLLTLREQGVALEEVIREYGELG